MRTELAMVVGLLVVTLTLPLVPAHADVDVTPRGPDSLGLSGEENRDAVNDGTSQENVSSGVQPSYDDASGPTECGMTPGPSGDFSAGPAIYCPGTPGGGGRDRETTQADLRRAVAEIPMPRLRARVQPAGRTLVNVLTIFYSEPQTLRRTVTLLGFEVDVEARPVRFTWHHGDGSSRATGSAGAPYPSKEVTHTYSRVADVLQVRVDTGWDVRFRVDGGSWTGLGEQLVSTGPATSLAVDQAAPVLTTP